MVNRACPTSALQRHLERSPDPAGDLHPSLVPDAADAEEEGRVLGRPGPCRARCRSPARNSRTAPAAPRRATRRAASPSTVPGARNRTAAYRVPLKLTPGRPVERGGVGGARLVRGGLPVADPGGDHRPVVRHAAEVGEIAGAPRRAGLAFLLSCAASAGARTSNGASRADSRSTRGNRRPVERACMSGASVGGGNEPRDLGRTMAEVNRRLLDGRLARALPCGLAPALDSFSTRSTGRTARATSRSASCGSPPASCCSSAPWWRSRSPSRASRRARSSWSASSGRSTDSSWA